MREEYDLETLEVSRRGPLPELQGAERSAKVRITIALDQEIVDYFKAKARKSGALPYQTQINQALRRMIELSEKMTGEQAAALKATLLEDRDFIRTVADKVSDALEAAA